MHAHKARIETLILRGQAEGKIRPEIDPTVLFRLIFGPIRLLIKQWGLSGYRFELLAEGMIRSTFSTTTMASSTRRPIASTIANMKSVNLL